MGQFKAPEDNEIFKFKKVSSSNNLKTSGIYIQIILGHVHAQKRLPLLRDIFYRL